MTHSDDLGLVLPPKLAPIHVAVVPIFKGEEELNALRKALEPVISGLREAGLTVKFDDDDQRRPGWKFAEYEAKGVPVRLALGPRDLANGQLEVARRDTCTKTTVALSEAVNVVKVLMDEIQKNLYDRAMQFRAEKTYRVNRYEELKKGLDEQPGFYLAHWDGTAETEEKIKTETKATVRCIPLAKDEETGVCIVTGKPSKRRVVFARAY